MTTIRVRATVAALHQGRLLLVPHLNTDAGPVQWHLPGGQVEVGEPLAQAAAREFAEETGLQAEIGDLLDIDEVLRPDLAHHSISVTFLGVLVGGRLQAEANHPYGTKTPRWFRPADLVGLAMHPPAAVAKALELIPTETLVSHAPAGYVCPFCTLVQGDSNPATLSTAEEIVYQDDTLTALIGSHQWPRNPGNTIIVPNQHYENVYELPPTLGTPIQRLIQRLARAMKAAWACDGVSTRQHNEPAGNQDVWHYHVHVTPRYHDDHFYGSERVLIPPAERVQLAIELRGTLERG